MVRNGRNQRLWRTPGSEEVGGGGAGRDGREHEIGSPGRFGYDEGGGVGDVVETLALAQVTTLLERETRVVGSEMGSLGHG